MADRPVDFSDDSGFSLLYEESLFPDGCAEVFVFPDSQSGVPDSCRRAGGWKLGKSLRSEAVSADAQARVRRKDADQVCRHRRTQPLVLSAI